MPDLPLTPPPTAQPPIQLSHQEMGDIYIARRRYQAALKEYKVVKPPNSGSWNGMGVAYQMLYDTKDALHCYKQAVRLDHKNVRALNNLGTIYDSLKDYGKGERYYRQALKVDPQSATALKNLGTNLLLQHKDKEGQEFYRRSLAADPEIFSEDRGAPVAATSAPVSDLGKANYQKARSCARAGIIDCALTNLHRALNEGVATLKMVLTEHDFDPIRKTPEFQRLLAYSK